MAYGLSRPTVALGAILFFGLGCFYVCVMIGRAVFCPVHYVGAMLGGMG